MGEMPKAMEPEDVDEIVIGHAETAVRAKEAGMDGVEIHSGYGGYLLSSFISPYMNRRDDEFGGSLENRMRVVDRTLRAVRDAVGPDFVVGIQVQGHDYSPDGIELPEAQEIAAPHRGQRDRRLHGGQGEHVRLRRPEHPGHAAPAGAVAEPGRRDQGDRAGDAGVRGRPPQRSRPRPRRSCAAATPRWSR